MSYLFERLRAAPVGAAMCAEPFDELMTALVEARMHAFDRLRKQRAAAQGAELLSRDC